MRNAAFNNEIQISDCFTNLEDIALMRKPFKKEWMQLYNSAFRNYVNGNWDEAKN